MREIIQNFADENHIDIVRVVNITSLSLEENRGYSCAILLVEILPKEWWIGKSNLLVTEKYGAAISMCSVLTDMPLNAVKSEMISSRCGECNLCVKVCPVQAIHGKSGKQV